MKRNDKRGNNLIDSIKERRAEVEAFSRYLQEKKLKLTIQREMILTTFLDQPGHISAEELFQKAKQKKSNVGFATVYRTLKHLSRCGLARELDFGEGRVKYESE